MSWPKSAPVRWSPSHSGDARAHGRLIAECCDDANALPSLFRKGAQLTLRHDSANNGGSDLNDRVGSTPVVKNNSHMPVGFSEVLEEVQELFVPRRLAS